MFVVYDDPNLQPTPSEIARIIQRIKGIVKKTELFGDATMMGLITSWNDKLQQMHGVVAKAKEAKHDHKFL